MRCGRWLYSPPFEDAPGPAHLDRLPDTGRLRRGAAAVRAQGKPDGNDTVDQGRNLGLPIMPLLPAGSYAKLTARIPGGPSLLASSAQ